MSFSAVNSVTKAATKILTGCTRHKTLTKASKMLAPLSLDQIGSNRTFTRSLWHLSRKTPVDGAGATARQKPLWSLSCGCGLHTEGDQQLVQFLKEEVKLEKESQNKVPAISGWESTFDGADVILKKNHDNETILVKFNVNNTVDSEMPPEQQQGQEDGQMVSLPPFTVEISKGGANKLTMHCSFPMSQDIQEAPEEQQEDAYEIEEICLSAGDVNDQTYAMSASVMDGNLYDLLMNMLDERGLDEEFAQKLVDFSTNYEHKCYIKFLDGLKDFVIEK